MTENDVNPPNPAYPAEEYAEGVVAWWHRNYNGPSLGSSLPLHELQLGFLRRVGEAKEAALREATELQDAGGFVVRVTMNLPASLRGAQVNIESDALDAAIQNGAYFTD